MNNERMYELLDYLDANPETHRQYTWTNINNNKPRTKKPDEVTINCGTAGCLAGHASFRYAPEGTIFYYDTLQVPNRELSHYPDYAREVLDISKDEDEYLFNSDRTREEMREYVDASLEEREEILNDNLYC